LALRAWATRSDALAREAHAVAASAEFRSQSWVGAEILLEDLGHPLDPVESQWLEPFDIVRRRWLDIFSGIVERARLRQPGSRN
jgi:hypothetical protein